MKISTRQYAKRQVKWIKKKLLPAVREQSEPDVVVYLLDATGESELLGCDLYLCQLMSWTDLSQWGENVRDKGLEVLRGALQTVRVLLIRAELRHLFSLSTSERAPKAIVTIRMRG